MKSKIRILAVGLLVIFGSLALTNVSLFAQSEKEITIEGTVVAVESDDDENVTAVAIAVTIAPKDSTEEEYVEEYMVARNRKGRKLLKLVGETVQASGTVETDEKGYKTIYVTDFKVIKKEEPGGEKPEK